MIANSDLTGKNSTKITYNINAKSRKTFKADSVGVKMKNRQLTKIKTGFGRCLKFTLQINGPGYNRDHDKKQKSTKLKGSQGRVIDHFDAAISAILQDLPLADHVSRSHKIEVETGMKHDQLAKNIQKVILGNPYGLLRCLFLERDSLVPSCLGRL